MAYGGRLSIGGRWRSSEGEGDAPRKGSSAGESPGDHAGVEARGLPGPRAHSNTTGARKGEGRVAGVQAPERTAGASPLQTCALSAGDGDRCRACGSSR